MPLHNEDWSGKQVHKTQLPAQILNKYSQVLDLKCIKFLIKATNRKEENERWLQKGKKIK